jgi:hypothetical protein
VAVFSRFFFFQKVMFSVTSSSCEDARGDVLRLEERISHWKQGFEIEFGRSPLESDIAGRPRVAALMKEYHKAQRVAALMVHSKKNQLTAEENRAPVPERKSTFNVLALSGHYLPGSKRLGPPPPPPPTAASAPPFASSSKSLSLEQAQFLLGNLSTAQRLLLCRLCASSEWTSDFGVAVEAAEASRALDGLAEARLVERGAQGRVRAAFPPEVAAAVLNTLRKMGEEEEEEREDDDLEEFDEEDGALVAMHDSDEDLDVESVAAMPVRAGFLRRGGSLMAAKLRNEADNRPLFALADGPVFAVSKQADEEDEEHEEDGEKEKRKRPNPDRPDKNFRRMKLTGQKKSFRRAGTGRWGSVNNSFVRAPTASTAEEEFEQQGQQKKDKQPIVLKVVFFFFFGRGSVAACFCAVRSWCSRARHGSAAAVCSKCCSGKTKRAFCFRVY